MTELAAARVPDYLDDMLRQSARTRQRPRWSALERWIPMGVIARTAPVRQVPWRSIAIAALLIVLAAAAVALFAGSQSRRLPAAVRSRPQRRHPTSIDGDIVTVDPVTGATKVIIGGPDHGRRSPCSRTSDDQLLFTRTASGAAAALWIGERRRHPTPAEVIGGDTAIDLRRSTGPRAAIAIIYDERGRRASLTDA